MIFSVSTRLQIKQASNYDLIVGSVQLVTFIGFIEKVSDFNPLDVGQLPYLVTLGQPHPISQINNNVTN